MQTRAKPMVMTKLPTEEAKFRIFPASFGRIFEDPARHAPQTGKMHHEKGGVETDEHQPKGGVSIDAGSAGAR